MTEFIFKKTDYINPNPEKDRRGVHKKGDLINYKPDGWAANWPNVGSYASAFVCIRCPEITLEEAQTVDYRKEWRDDFGYEILATNPAQGRYTVRVFEQNPGAESQNALTAAKINSFLIFCQQVCAGFWNNLCQHEF